jgi:CRISPR-associated protein Cmr3
MFKYLITVSPLGLMYGSAGAFLAANNLVGQSGAKFPPDAPTLAGLFFSTNHATNQALAPHDELKNNLNLAGPFWADKNNPAAFYVPLPRHRIIDETDFDEWQIEGYDWQRNWQKPDLKTHYFWQRIDTWQQTTAEIHAGAAEGKVAGVPWKYISFLHPKLKDDERHSVGQDGLFLENAVQLDEDYCLVYLATYALPNGWYRLGGEGHMVEIESLEISPADTIYQLLSPAHQIQRACALITPGLWGSNHLSYRYPKHPEFPRTGIKMLTDKPQPYRYRMGNRDTQRGRLSRGRYALPGGSVYVFKQPLHKTWWEFPPDWFPEKGLLKRFGCGLCLPIQIQGVV